MIWLGLTIGIALGFGLGRVRFDATTYDGNILRSCGELVRQTTEAAQNGVGLHTLEKKLIADRACAAFKAKHSRSASDARVIVESYQTALDIVRSAMQRDSEAAP